MTRRHDHCRDCGSPLSFPLSLRPLCPCCGAELRQHLEQLAQADRRQRVARQLGLKPDPDVLREHLPPSLWEQLGLL